MDLMMRRSVLLASGKKDKYLDFDGTFYFNTGYIPTSDTQVIVKFSADNDNAINNPIFGSRVSSTRNTFLAWAGIDRAKRMRLQRRSATDPIWGNLDYQLDLINQYVIDTLQNGLFLNGQKVANFGNGVSTYSTSNFSFYIGAINNDGAPLSTYRFIGKLYNFKIYENDVLTANYVPRNGNLKDTISGTVLTPIYA